MRHDEYDSPAFISNTLNLHNAPNAPYCSSLATSASASTGSVWSVASSQNSLDTTISAPTSDCDSQLAFSSQLSDASCAPARNVETVPSELRKNPRRTSHSATSRSGCPPQLVRQVDRKVNFVDNLVDSSTQIVEAIWPTSSVICRNDGGSSGMLSLRTFIQETLRRSRTSYSTLQVALYYLILIKPHVPDHDFTMEQPEDSHATRALQCGRRMFLAALILASKYLQDRNYSARAWSKISGLATQEIFQNEMAFLHAVNWSLHITEEVYNRWTDCVMRFTPPQPPSPGGAAQLHFERQCDDFKKIILQLTPELDNVDDLAPCTPASAKSHDFSVVSPRSLLSARSERPCYFGYEAADQATPMPKSFGTPLPLEPHPAAGYTAGRVAPALGLLPTPRLTPQSAELSTPAASAATTILGKSSSMGLALAQASQYHATQALDRWAAPQDTSPQGYFTTRRSSLANSISTASSPESMVSDSSRTSRSSSISSASSLVSAPSTKLDVQARYRYAKLCGERLSLKPTVASVPEDYEENRISSSPDSYTGPVAKDVDMSLDTPLAQREREMDDAARALQDLHNSHRNLPAQQQPVAIKAGSKRSRPLSMDNSLQDNVRDMLKGQLTRERSWPDTLVRPRLEIRTNSDSQQIPVRANLNEGRKRVCCSAEAFQPYGMSSLHSAMGGVGGPGMWAGILN